MKEQNNQFELKEIRKSSNLIVIIIILLLFIAGGTFAYFSFSASNTIISGSSGSVDLTLTVTKILPATTETDDILIISFDELATSLNNNCLDDDGEFALCQLYKVNLANSEGSANGNVKGSISFDNSTAPNLSWISLGTTYSSSTTYTSDILGSTFNTASSTFTNFVNSYIVNAGTNVDFYILVWVNESEEEQNDQGSYSGTIKFEDSNGKGVTSTFTS